MSAPPAWRRSLSPGKVPSARTPASIARELDVIAGSPLQSRFKKLEPTVTLERRRTLAPIARMHRSVLRWCFENECEAYEM
jgi:hypothetical protein